MIRRIMGEIITWGWSKDNLPRGDDLKEKDSCLNNLGRYFKFSCNYRLVTRVLLSLFLTDYFYELQ